MLKNQHVTNVFEEADINKSKCVLCILFKRISHLAHCLWRKTQVKDKGHAHT